MIIKMGKFKKKDRKKYFEKIYVYNMKENHFKSI